MFYSIFYMWVPEGVSEGGGTQTFGILLRYITSFLCKTRNPKEHSQHNASASCPEMVDVI